MSTTQITSLENLREAIQLLEKIKSEEEMTLREHYDITYDSVKPIKLLKRTFEELAALTEIKSNLLSLSLSLAAGYFTKKLFEKVSGSSYKKLLGTTIMFGITSILAKHPEFISNLGRRLINILSERTGQHAEVVEINPQDSPFHHDPE